ncbi:hypothetical protein C4D60_Mb00t02270 [Musa balbisiana]|uniref:Uncharacterized protein n=1 Tax=Musa balbisiana TaxID=52838 RepID=A0A4S8I3P7_MUSBA|nr:hypothetical protein C4D60_Mb00t02270 [Musa balbisiana]
MLAAFYLSQADTPQLPRSTYRGRDAGGPGARACWGIERKRGGVREGALRSAAQMVPYEVSIGLILIMRLVSTFDPRSARIFP